MRKTNVLSMLGQPIRRPVRVSVTIRKAPLELDELCSQSQFKEDIGEHVVLPMLEQVPQPHDYEGGPWLAGTMICLLQAPLVQLSTGAGIG